MYLAMFASVIVTEFAPVASHYEQPDPTLFVCHQYQFFQCNSTDLSFQVRYQVRSKNSYLSPSTQCNFCIHIGNITNGITAELIRTDSGHLHGYQVTQLSVFSITRSSTF